MYAFVPMGRGPGTITGRCIVIKEQLSNIGMVPRNGGVRACAAMKTERGGKATPLAIDRYR